MIVLLVRHARAGDREKWEGDDRLRPLDEKGCRQADGLVELLGSYPVDAIVSSPYLRCTQTVEPLAAARGLRVEAADELAEGKERADVLELIERTEGQCVVLCSHGDVVFELLGEPMKKGATSVLDVSGGELRPRERLPRPR